MFCTGVVHFRDVKDYTMSVTHTGVNERKNGKSMKTYFIFPDNSCILFLEKIIYAYNVYLHLLCIQHCSNNFSKCHKQHNSSSIH
jgi:hypothetical protein